MNISQLLPNVKGRTINRTNAATIADAAEQLPRYIVGQNGTIRQDIQEISKKLQRCGTGATVAKNGNSSKILEMHRCGIHKICPTCADAVSGNRIRKLDSALKNNWDTAKYCYMITYTIRDDESLHSAMTALKNGYRKFYLMGQKRETGYSLGEAHKFLGGQNSFEIKLGRNSEMWHPHLHQIVFTNDPIDFSVYDPEIKKQAERKGYKRGEDSQAFKKFMIENNGCKYLWETNSGDKKPCSKLSHEWRRATNGAGANCRVDVIYTPETRPKNFSSLFEKLRGKTESEIKSTAELRTIKSVKYALKYSVKPGELENMTAEQIFELFDTTKKIRSVEPFGFLRKKQEPRKPKKQEIDKEIEKTIKEIERKIEIDDMQKWIAASKISVYSTPTAKEDFEIHAQNFEDANIVLDTKEVPYHIRRAAADNITRDDTPREHSAPGYASHKYYHSPELMRDAVPAAVALWQLGLAEQREFQKKTAERVGAYRRERGYIHTALKIDLIDSECYVSMIEESRLRMRRAIKKYKYERDADINRKTSGLYFDIVQNTSTRGGIGEILQRHRARIAEDKNEKQKLKNEGKQLYFL